VQARTCSITPERKRSRDGIAPVARGEPDYRPGLDADVAVTWSAPRTSAS
jgi:hypothetical protein